MNNSNGWIKIHRDIKYHWIFENPHYFRAWVLILVEVNHKDKKTCINSELIECKRGQSLNSVGMWVKKLGKGWSPQKIRTFLKLLESDSMVVCEGLRKTTRLTVCNYGTYQSEQQTDNKQITNRQQTDNKQITTNNNVKNVKECKNVKNVKKEKNIYTPFKNSIKEIVDYLNNVCGKKYRDTGDKTKKVIVARLNEKFVVDDFKKVIDIKYRAWGGDEKMREYLRPETLFGNKFESYLNSNTLSLPTQGGLYSEHS